MQIEVSFLGIHLFSIWTNNKAESKKTHGKSIQQLIGSIRAKTLKIESPVIEVLKAPWSDLSGIKRLKD